MSEPSPEQVAADLARLISPGLRSPRSCLTVLPAMAAVQAELARGAPSAADAVEIIVNRGLTAMTAGAADDRLRRSAADPVKALRAALALRPGSERIKSRTRRATAAHAMGLLSADGWRAHHEKALLRDLANVICATAVAPPETHRASPAGPPPASPGIGRFYADFVDIQADWDSLFAASSSLDLAVMYGATWRNTYRKDLSGLAGRPDGRIRVVLPEPSPGSMLIRAYAHASGMAPGDLSRKVTEAIEDFRLIGPRRHVEIYLTTAVFRHSIYLFTHQAILALYALCGERIPTPALLASEGGLLSFIREDFDRLLEHSNRIA
jgi:hypothetical protein